MSRSTTNVPPARAARRRVQSAASARSSLVARSSRIGEDERSGPRNSSVGTSRTRIPTTHSSSAVRSGVVRSDSVRSDAVRSSSVRSGAGRSSATASRRNQRSVPQRIEAVQLRLSRPARLGVAFLGLVLLLVALSFVGVLPVRTYISQRNELRSKQARVEMLSVRNDELNGRIQRLRTDAEVVRMARDQFGMVPKGDTLTVLPGLRDETLVLSGNGSSAVDAAPPASGNYQPSFFEAISHLLMFWHN